MYITQLLRLFTANNSCEVCEYSSTCPTIQGLGLLRASEEGVEATVTSLLHSGVDPNFTHTVREREREV